MDVPSSSWVSMRQVTQNTLLNDVLKAVRSADGVNYRVLVLDHRATRVLSACLRVTDITELGVALVESLEKSRQPFPDLEVIYLCDSNSKSIDRILKDFEEKPLYKKAHLFFLQRLCEESFTKLKACQPLLSRVATLTEINLNYLAVEESVFHFDIPTAMVSLYNQETRNCDETCGDMVNNLVTLCATMNEYPFIRYDSKNKLSARLAKEFQAKFNVFIQANENFSFRGDEMDGNGDMRRRATLLVLDRAADPYTPLMHLFSYQSMVGDLMNIKDDVCKYYKGDLKNYNGQDMGENAEKDFPDVVKVCLLNDDDQLWKEFRNLQIRDVIERLNSYLEQYMETSVGKMTKRAEGQPTASLEEMNRAIQELPEYREMMEKHTQHLQIVRLCMHKLEKQQLLQCADVEQAMVTGVDKDGLEANKATIMKKLNELVSNPSIGMVQTTRLIALFLISQDGVTEQDRRSIIQAANPSLNSDVQEALISISGLGASFVEGGLSVQQQFVKKRKDNIKQAKEFAKTCTNSYNRYTPLVGDLVDQLCSGKLNREHFPYVYDPPPSIMDDNIVQEGQNLGSKTSGFSLFGSKTSTKSSPISTSSTSNVKSVRSRGKQQLPATKSATPPIAPSKTTSPKSIQSPLIRKNVNDPRLIVFVAGGATYAELVSVAQVAEKFHKDIIVGSSHILKPANFIAELKFLQAGYTSKYFEEIEAKIAEKERIAQELLQNNNELVSTEENAPNKRKKSFLESLGCGCMGPPPQSI